MNEEILNKLHTVLYAVSPLASDRDRIIEEMGEVIWLGALERMLTSLPENLRMEIVALLNEDKLDEAVKILESQNVDIDTILGEVSTEVMNDVMTANKK